MVLLLLHHIEVGYILLVGPKVHAAVRVDPVLGLLVHEVGVVHVGQLAECRLDLMSLLLLEVQQLVLLLLDLLGEFELFLLLYFNLDLLLLHPLLL